MCKLSVCVFLTQEEAALRIQPLFVQEDAAGAAGRAGSFPPLLEPDVCGGKKNNRK